MDQDLETLNYVRKVNQTDKNKSLRRNEIDDMVDDYELARQEIITRFSVMVKTSDAKQVYVNFSDNYIMGVLDKIKNYSKVYIIDRDVRWGFNFFKALTKINKSFYILYSALSIYKNN